LEELLKVVNKHPKKLSDLNDINRFKETYSQASQLRLPKFLRQNIVIQKFRTAELEFLFEQYCS